MFSVIEKHYSMSIIMKKIVFEFHIITCYELFKSYHSN